MFDTAVTARLRAIASASFSSIRKRRRLYPYTVARGATPRPPRSLSRAAITPATAVPWLWRWKSTPSPSTV